MTIEIKTELEIIRTGHSKYTDELAKEWLSIDSLKKLMSKHTQYEGEMDEMPNHSMFWNELEEAIKKDRK